MNGISITVDGKAIPWTRAGDRLLLEASPSRPRRWDRYQLSLLASEVPDALAKRSNLQFSICSVVKCREYYHEARNEIWLAPMCSERLQALRLKQRSSGLALPGLHEIDRPEV